MFPMIAVALAAGIAGVLGFAATRPDEFRVTRNTRIGAPRERIFPLIDDFRAWQQWSPWDKLDPAMTRTLGGPARGPGATYEWSGTKKVGSGRMEITSTTPPERVTIKLDFLTPFEAHNTTEFELVPAGDATDLTWTMHGESTYMTKVMGVFVNIDKMVGRDFEKGLAAMKDMAESAGTPT